MNVREKGDGGQKRKDGHFSSCLCSSQYFLLLPPSLLFLQHQLTCNSSFLVSDGEVVEERSDECGTRFGLQGRGRQTGTKLLEGDGQSELNRRPTKEEEIRGRAKKNTERDKK